ncbi:MAG: hypothetical protein WBJ09_07970 [Candidatus Cloacimonas acidaminovorans]
MRKWVKRYQQNKEDGLKDLPRKKTHSLISIWDRYIKKSLLDDIFFTTGFNPAI